MAVDWRLAGSLEQLRAQLDELAPDRSRASDGAIGDAEHATRDSDHNPWWSLAGQHYVTARDFTHDPGGGLDCDALAEALERGRDQRVKYVIWDDHIMSGRGGPDPWEWRKYRPSDPRRNKHTHHLHLSVVPDLRSLTRIPWLLPGLAAAVPTLRRGSSGPAVSELQRVLAAWYPDLQLQVDDDFGPATDAAVRLAQQRGGLVVDGVVGPRTRALLHL